MQYGAKADGITDDAPAFAAAINAAGSSGVVYAPAGTYNLIGGHTIGGDLNCNISLPSGVSLRGDGPGQTVLIGSGTTSCNVVGAVGASGICVTDMTIRADAAVVTQRCRTQSSSRAAATLSSRASTPRTSTWPSPCTAASR